MMYKLKLCIVVYVIRPTSNKNDWFPGLFPMVPGHEIVGKIVKVGDHVKTSR